MRKPRTAVQAVVVLFGLLASVLPADLFPPGWPCDLLAGEQLLMKLPVGKELGFRQLWTATQTKKTEPGEVEEYHRNHRDYGLKVIEKGTGEARFRGIPQREGRGGPCLLHSRPPHSRRP